MEKEITIQCPHCTSKLQVEQSWGGKQVTCPVCDKPFIIRVPENSCRTEKSAPENEKKQRRFWQNDYPWGRAYIIFARIIALLHILCIIAVIGYIIAKPFIDHHKQIKGIKESAVPELVEQQNKFQEKYIQIAQLMLTASQAERMFDFSHDLAEIPGFFNEKLITVDDIENSRKVLELYDVKISKMSEKMHLYFSAQFRMIERQLNQGKGLRHFPVSQPKSASKSRKWAVSFGQNIDFFTSDRSNVFGDIRIVRKGVEMLEANHELKYKNALENIKKGVEFINKNLISSKHELGTEKKETHTESPISNPGYPQKEKFEAERQILGFIIGSLNRLSSHQNREYYCWQIAVESDKLHASLKKHKVKIETAQNIFYESLKVAVFHSLIIFFAGCFAAFMLMVFADYLCAHFDSAVNLKSISSKMKCFLFISLLILTGLTGCGKSPTEKLSEEIKTLHIAAVNNCFIKRIAENPDAASYIVPGKELVQILGGFKKISEAKKDMELVTGAFYYQVQHIACSSTVSYSNIQEYEKAPYSYRGRLSLHLKYAVRISDTKADPDGTAGVEFCTFTPEDFSSFSVADQKKWRESEMQKIPSVPINHAVAIHNVMKNKPLDFVENVSFDILYNSKSKTWELAEAEEISSYSAPPVYSEDVLAQTMKNLNYKKITISDAGNTRDYWFRPEDYELAEKIFNQGLVKYNGVWKKRSLVEQTAHLQKAIDAFNRRGRVSLGDLKNFIMVIKENRAADNKATAAALAEKTLMQFCNKFAKEKEREKELLSFIEYVNELSASEVIDDKKIVKIAREYLDNIYGVQIEGCKDWLRNLFAMSDIVKTFKKDSDWLKFRNKLRAFTDFKLTRSEKTYVEILKQLQTLKDVMRGDSISISFLLNQNGKCGQYSLGKNCQFCSGTGIKNCASCKNSGVCALCKGSGARYVTEIRRRGGSAIEFKTLSICNRVCDSCTGRSAQCPACKGKRITLDKDLVAAAFEKNIEDLEVCIDQMISNVKGVSAQYEQERRKNKSLLQSIDAQ